MLFYSVFQVLLPLIVDQYSKAKDKRKTKQKENKQIRIMLIK